MDRDRYLRSPKKLHKGKKGQDREAIGLGLSLGDQEVPSRGLSLACEPCKLCKCSCVGGVGDPFDNGHGPIERPHVFDMYIENGVRPIPQLPVYPYLQSCRTLGIYLQSIMSLLLPAWILTPTLSGRSSGNLTFGFSPC